MAQVTTKQYLASVEQSIKSELVAHPKALPQGLNQQRFILNCITVVNDNLKDFQGITPESIGVTLAKGAYLGLDFFNRECYAIPYGGKVQFQTDYKGEIKLCKKYSREPIKDIYAKLVRKGDFFEELIENGQQFVNFKPIPFNSEEVLGAFAIVLYKDGSMMYDTMSVTEIEKTRSTYSKAKNSQAWKESPGEMQKKTVLRRLCKLIDLEFDNIEQRRAFDEGAGVEFEETPSKVMRKGADEDTPADVLGDDNVIDGDFKEVPQEPDAEMYAGIDAMDDGELPFK